MHHDMAERISTGAGFIAALDQSGGSTPKALAQYGVTEDAWTTEDEMFALVHEMRTRIIRSPAFSGDRVIGAILFEDTMERSIDGMPTARYLWREKGVVPFLKVDRGLAEPASGARLMKPMPGLDGLCERAVAQDVFGTKMRSVIDAADRAGISAIVAQQFEIGARILGHGLMPILEPEVTITIPDKAAAEDILRAQILARLDTLPEGTQVMLKLTLPEADNHYLPLVEHPRVMRVVALSGGYSRDDANARLARQTGVIASFSRALAEGLRAQQTDAEFDATLDAAIASIHAASVAG
jgi:fructose-bisphosphate aldolase, class I